MTEARLYSSSDSDDNRGAQPEGSRLSYWLGVVLLLVIPWRRAMAVTWVAGARDRARESTQI
jgi:hypothetical protein